mgnify:FL=1|jgi:hypothetical protein
MFNRLFDLNGDGKMDAAERALEYMNFRAVTGADDDAEDTEDDFFGDDSDDD